MAKKTRKSKRTGPQGLETKRKHEKPSEEAEARAFEDAKGARKNAGMPEPSADGPSSPFPKKNKSGGGKQPIVPDDGDDDLVIDDAASNLREAVRKAMSEDELVQLLALLDPAYVPKHTRGDKPEVKEARQNVSNGEQLRDLIVGDVGWYNSISQPVADGVVPTEEAIVHEGAKGKALLLRGRAAQLWDVGTLEKSLDRAAKVYKVDPIDNFHDLLQRGRNSKTGNEKIKDLQKGRTDLSSWNVPSVENVKKKLLHLAVESNVDEFSALSKMVKVPAFFQECNYVGDKRGAFIQMVHSQQHTHYHRDNNGTDTWMKLLAGEVLVACWSQEDGDTHNLHDEIKDQEMDWSKFKAMQSAKLFQMRPGDGLFIPAGSYHYVYTIKTKIVIAGDFINSLGWERRVASVKRDADVLDVKPEVDSLDKIFFKGLQVEKARLEKEKLPVSMLRRQELMWVNAWANALKDEGVEMTPEAHAVLHDVLQGIFAR